MEVFLRILNLNALYMRNNYFTGTIPPGLGHLPSLIYLELLDNDLTGTLPTEFNLRHRLFLDGVVSFVASESQLAGTLLD